MKKDKYAYRVTWSPADLEYVGTCVEFPLLSWLAQTQDEAFNGIKSLVQDSIADMKTTGEQPPTPMSERPYSGKFMVRVPPALHRRLVTKAEEEGISLNQLVVNRLTRDPLR